MVIMEVGLSMLTPKWTLIQTMIGENSNYPSLEINPKFEDVYILVQETYGVCLYCCPE